MKQEFRVEALDFGDEWPPLRVRITREQVRRYARAANMPGGRFASDEAARREGLPGMIVPGNMSMALFSRMLVRGPRVRLQRLSATFRGLVRPEVPLTLRAVVTDKQVLPEGTQLECDLLLENPEGERLVTGTATVLVLPDGTG